MTTSTDPSREPDDLRLPPRRNLLPPIREIHEAAELLHLGAERHVASDPAGAARAFAAADMPVLYEWTKPQWGRMNQQIHRVRTVPGAPPTIPKNMRAQPRMPDAAGKRALIARDGHNCRFCGIPVIRKEVRSYLTTLYPKEVRWGPREADQHCGFQTMWLQYDHVLPNSRGGTSEPDNMVVTCAACNFGRGEYLLEEMALIDPRGFPPVKTDWDGLERVLPETARYPGRGTDCGAPA